MNTVCNEGGAALGANVKLTGGSMVMTIIEVLTNQKPGVYKCFWHDVNGVPHSAVLPGDALVFA